jgi:hypothetical protein
MGAAGQIYQRAQSLTGADVTDSHAMAQAKLTDRCVVADPGVVNAVRGLYQRTAPPKNSALQGAQGLTLRAEPLRPVASSVPGRAPIERS